MANKAVRLQERMLDGELLSADEAAIWRAWFIESYKSTNEWGAGAAADAAVRQMRDHWNNGGKKR